MAQPSHASLVIRSALFNAAFYINIIVLMILLSPVLLMPRLATQWLARLWGRTSLWLLRVICGVTLEFRGLENLPQGPALIAPKHQSFLETFALLLHVRDFSYVLKRELMWIPMFGWLLWSAAQVAINRSNGRTALAQVIEASKKLFAQRRNLFIFPEGTRRPIDALAAYKGGVGYIYEANSVPCVPVALNTGLFWPRRKFMRYPGHCVIEFLPAIPPGLSRADFMATLQTRIEGATAALNAEARAQSPWLAQTGEDTSSVAAS